MKGSCAVTCAIILAVLSVEAAWSLSVNSKVVEDLPVCPPGNGEIILFPKPENCSEFYQCANGYPYTQHCYPGLFYCAATEVCEYAGRCDFSNCQMYPVLTEEKQEVPQVEAEAPTCPPPSSNPEIITYPNPENCSNFYRCDNGHAEILDCPPGLLYCEEEKVCAWSWNKNCSYDYCKIVSAKEIKSDNHLSKTVELEDLPVCPPGNGEIILFPKPENCSEFYQCANGYPYTQHCYPGLFYCAATEVCEYAGRCDFSNCQMYPVLTEEKQEVPQVEAEAPTCPPPSSNPEIITYPNPENCSNFYRCDNGHAEILDCPPGLLYCEEEKVCAWSWNKNCSYDYCKIVSAKEIKSDNHLSKTVELEDLPVCPPGNGEIILFPKPENCSEFYQCANGYPYTQHCYPGLFYCAATEVCEYAGRCDFSNCQMYPVLTEEKQEVPQVEAEAPTCPPPSSNPEIITYPNPENCSNFYRCDNGHAEILDCPPGLLYCEEEKVCAWSWNKNCSYDYCKIVSAKEIKSDNHLSKTVELEDLPVCPPGNGEIILFPKPENCSEFYQCANGYPYTQHCYPGLFYCAATEVCEYAGRCDFSNCQMYPVLTEEKQEVPQVEAEAPTCPPPSSNPEIITYPNPENCSNFYRCDNGHAEILDCPPGLLYCEEEKVCAWSWNKNCSYDYCKIVSAKEIKSDSHLSKTVELEDLPVCPPGNGEIILFPKPENCSEFYQCANGYPYTQHCYPGLFYCAATEVCEYAGRCDFSNCQMYPILTEEKQEVPQVEAEAPTCPPPSSNPEIITYPNPENCSNFYRCDNGHAEILDCPPGLLYCEEEKVCAWSWNKNCSYDYCKIVSAKEIKSDSHLSKTVELEDLPVCPPGNGEIILFPKPENCSEFYQCANGYPYTQHCYPGLFYCAATEVCEYAGRCDFSNCQMYPLTRESGQDASKKVFLK